MRQKKYIFCPKKSALQEIEMIGAIYFFCCMCVPLYRRTLRYWGTGQILTR
jgi:hypothetical protein